MNCKDISKLFTAYLDGEVTPEEQEQIRAHLSTCPRCRKELEALAATQYNLRQALRVTAAGVTPSPQIWAGLRQRLEAEEQLGVTIWGLAKSKVKGGINMIRELVSRQPVWKTALVSVLAIVLITGLAITVPALTGQSSEALAAEIAQNSPQVKAALGDGEVKVIKVIKIVDDEGIVICEGELGIILTEVDLKTKEVTKVEVVPMPEFTAADEQEAINIAKADPRVQELLDKGASIGKVSPAYFFGARLNEGTGEIEEFSGALARVAIELGEKNWAAEVDLTEGKVVRLVEVTSGEYYKVSKKVPGKYEIEYFDNLEGPEEEPAFHIIEKSTQ